MDKGFYLIYVEGVEKPEDSFWKCKTEKKAEKKAKKLANKYSGKKVFMLKTMSVCQKTVNWEFLPPSDSNDLPF